MQGLENIDWANLSVAIAGALVIITGILGAPKVIDKARDWLAEYNRGKKQDAESQIELLDRAVRANNDAFEKAMAAVTRNSADNAAMLLDRIGEEVKARRASEERVRELEERVRVQAAEIVDLRAKVDDQAHRLTEMTVKMGEDGSGKKKIRTRRTTGA